MKQKCTNCKHGKLIRTLNSSQHWRTLLANALNENHQLSCDKKYEMLEEIVSEFCKIGKINKHEKCEHYKRKWWKFWVKEK